MRLALRLILIVLCLAACPCGNAEDADVFTVVIDPGHGGHDSGCVGRKAKEKAIVLNVALLLRDKIRATFGKDVDVVMTRTSDKFVTLEGRADIANRAHGDLFISIHVNSVAESSAGRKSVQGASVYTCGLHKSQSNLAVAMRENSVMTLEPDFSAIYEGFDPNSSESYIMFELSQSRHQQQSLTFAQLAKQNLVSHAHRSDKGVRQAGFWVLWATAMPSVLVELDFICNPTVEDYLNSDKGQQQCAEALFRAFKAYYSQTKN